MTPHVEVPYAIGAGCRGNLLLVRFPLEHDSAAHLQPCSSSGEEPRELGTAFMVLGAMQQRVIGWWPVNERMCRLRIRGRFFNLSIINVHSPHLTSTDDEKEAIYTQLEREYDRCPKHDVKVVIGDLNAQVGQEEAYKLLRPPAD